MQIFVSTDTVIKVQPVEAVKKKTVKGFQKMCAGG